MYSQSFNLMIPVILICCLLLSFPVIAGTEEVESLYFKETEIREVLRSLARAAGTNLITDGSVTGKTTINLQGISFEKALKLITRTHELDYYWDEDTVVVARPDKIGSLYEKRELITFDLEKIEGERAERIIAELFPEVVIETYQQRGQVSLVGPGSQVREAREILEEIGRDLKKEQLETRTEVLGVSGLDVKQLEAELESLYPDLNLGVENGGDRLYIQGPASLVAKGQELVEEIREQPRVRISTIEYDHLEREDIEGLLQKLVPELEYNILGDYRRVIVEGLPEQVTKARELIAEQDSPRQQVIIEARIEEISRDKLEKFGVAPEQLSRMTILRDGGSIEGVEMSWPDFLEALRDEGVSHTLANPRLMTVNGSRARMLIGDRIPVETEEVSEGEVLRSIDYIEAGITLDFHPWITREEKVKLSINPRVSSVGESLSGSLPSINTREVETEVLLDDGQTFVIAGLLQDDLIENMSRVPVLAEIPLFGHLFENRQTREIKTEVLIIIRPSIVRGQGEQLELNRRERILPQNDT